jgi:tetratricopeptide (TPR) repeat protein
MGHIQNYLGNNALAQKQLTKALNLFEQHEANRTIVATNAHGEALSNLAEVSYSKGDFVKASNQLESALKTFQNDRKGEARVRLFKSYIAGSIGETDKAVEEISRALKLYREINDKSGEGLALTAMGLWHSSRKDESDAIKTHNEAIKIFRDIGDRHSEAIAHNALGQAYENLTEYSNALSYRKSALELFQNTGALDAAAAAAFNVGWAQQQSGDLDQALTYYERCLRLSRSAGKRRTEAYALNQIATVYGAQGRHEQALKQYQNLQKFYKGIGDMRGQATALNSHGDLLLKLGQKQRALDIYRQALPLSETIDDKDILISTLYNLARANLELGAPEVALSFIERSIEISEDLRANVGSQDFRLSYFSGVREHYDLCVEILMQLERLRPGKGFAAKAFLVNEKGRARLLLDLLSESRANIRAGAATELVERERRLKRLLQLQAQYQMTLSLSGKDSSEIAEVADQIAQLRSEYQTVQAQLREKNPRLFSFEQFAAVDLERFRRRCKTVTRCYWNMP